MNNPLHRIPFVVMLALVVGHSSLGCDITDPDTPADRSAILTVELDGEVVDRSDLSLAPQVQADLIDLAESTVAEVCEDDAATLDLVLEIDGEPAASVQGCMDATSPGAEAITAAPDVQASVWCTACDMYEDCFSCCRCAGHRISYCGFVC